MIIAMLATQLTKAYVAETSCTQLLLIDTFCYVCTYMLIKVYSQRSNEPLQYHDDVDLVLFGCVIVLVLPLRCVQFESLKKFIDNGGSVCMMMMEGGEEKQRTNVNFLLEEYGIMVNTGEWEGKERGGRRGEGRGGRGERYYQAAAEC